MAKRKADIKISLQDWDLPKLSNKIETITGRTHDKIEKALEDFMDHFYDKSVENLVKGAVSDFLTYASKDGYMADFFHPRKEKGQITFHLSFSDYDYVDVTTTLRNEIEVLLLSYSDDDKKIEDHYQQHFRELAEELKSLSRLIERRLK